MGNPVKDQQFDAVSILYHALQGANTCRTYIEDAAQSGDKDLEKFFHEVNDHYQQIAAKAKQVVKQKIA